jgi:excisionase family DNA binding protein
MTRPLGPGHLIVDPVDVGLLAFLVREGVMAVGARAALPPRVSQLLATVEVAAAAARTAAGCGSANGAVRAAGQPAQSSPDNAMTVTEVAQVIGRTPQRVRQLVADGTLPARRAGRRTLLVDADAVASYALARRAVA